MTVERMVNNGQTTVGSFFVAGGATLIVADATSLPPLGSGEVFHAICYTTTSPGNAEIIRVTSVSGNTLTVETAAEAVAGVQTAFDHPTGDVLACVITVEALLNFISQLVPAGGSTSWNESPTGDVNGSNVDFTLLHGPSPAQSLQLYLNGVLQRSGGSNDFTLAGSTITYNSPPQSGDTLTASYTY